MQVQIKQITGSWDLGYALHKHSLHSTFTGHNEFGHPTYDTTRSEPGEALYQLKYRNDWSQAGPIAAQIKTSILPLFETIGLIVPMPASTLRARQPVDEIANELAKVIDASVFNNIVVKAPAPEGSTPLKNLNTKAEKDAALAGRFSINDQISGDGSWNALLLDDLYDTGATMDAVCKTLKTYPKIARVYAVAVTWK
ncbi:ComF family protein [Rhizobium sp. Leaf262]|uniref:ComF family protein n=1 Tax=Rhizobium sp. Leaf262 TaxID=1736312 RepID=UPI0007152FAA|nr:ComF family protein [Rhizobium sp. Leaf262]KQO79555.1 amidophosphoribosyltransferase [Rhizobium sp. Leaf262]